MHHTYISNFFLLIGEDENNDCKICEVSCK
jgi:hypothetical protein